MIFDGKQFGREIEAKLSELVKAMNEAPKMVSVLIGDDQASSLYTKLKKQAADRVGIKFEIVHLVAGETTHSYGSKIMQIGAQDEVDGVMVQLPIPGFNRSDTEKLLSMIPLHKDVDGLRWEQSEMMPATVKAVLTILHEIESKYEKDVWSRKFCVLGARGAVGRPLVHFLKQKRVSVSEVEWDSENPSETIKNSEVIISCVGKASLVKDEMVEEGSIVIDVGMSSLDGKVVGDMENSVYQKASIAVPVPGGVGPVTIACLLQNVVEVRGKL